MIDLAQATAIVDKALSHGRTLALPPLSPPPLTRHTTSVPSGKSWRG